MVDRYVVFNVKSTPWFRTVNQMNVIALLSNCVTPIGVCLCLEIEEVSINFVEKDFRKSMELKRI